MSKKNAPRRTMALWASCIVAAAACAGCSGGDGSGSSDGTGGSGNTGSGSPTGSGSTTPTGSGSGTPTGSGTTNPTGSSGSGASSVDVYTTGNPFAGADIYVNPDYAVQIDKSIATHPADKALLDKVKSIPTALWLDTIGAIDGGEWRKPLAKHLDDALAEQNSKGKPVVTLIVVYDLPNRDCAALASNGELKVDADGVNKYKTEYIDKLATVFKAHPNQRIVAIVEPDSLPNLATNLMVPKCAASDKAYRESVAYAVKTLSEASKNAYLYLDSAHSGWLGWDDNRKKVAKIYKEVLDEAGGVTKIRGFISNVSNYTVLDSTKPPLDVFDYQFNPCHDEWTFAAKMQASLAAEGVTNNAWLIDTSRNGVGGIRKDWGYWCNNMGAGLGERPQADPKPGIDAYVWVKPPGESDGTSDMASPRYDGFCGKENAAKPAPEAGQWFDDYFVEVVKKANPPL